MKAKTKNSAKDWLHLVKTVNMVKLIKLNLMMGVFLLLTSCAIFSTSMTPSQVYDVLPNLTKSKFMSQTQAEEAVKANKCKCLVKGRTYTVPIGFTVKDDLKNAAKGIDEWVTLDGGNAYALVGYKWVSTEIGNSAQLHVEFDTMQCE